MPNIFNNFYGLKSNYKLHTEHLIKYLCILPYILYSMMMVVEHAHFGITASHVAAGCVF